MNVAGIKLIRTKTFDQRRNLSLYQKIKSAITVRQVGEMYGMEPDRHGMVCCPFHSDSDPSMKLNDTYYYCFGCGANGDAIALPPPKRGLTDEQWADIATACGC